jgi:hypothetical protein
MTSASMIVYQALGRGKLARGWKNPSQSKCVRTIGKSGGELSLPSHAAKLILPRGAVTSNIEVCLRDATATTSQADAAYRSASQKLGATPSGPLLELLPHGASFRKKVTIELAVVPGDENKPMALLHHDVDPTVGPPGVVQHA